VHHDIATAASEYPINPLSSAKRKRGDYSDERTTPTALVKTRGRRQYPNTLAVRIKLTPVRDIKFRMK
jgi:hypothetical protein